MDVFGHKLKYGHFFIVHLLYQRPSQPLQSLQGSVLDDNDSDVITWLLVSRLPMWWLLTCWYYVGFANNDDDVDDDDDDEYDSHEYAMKNHDKTKDATTTTRTTVIICTRGHDDVATVDSLASNCPGIATSISCDVYCAPWKWLRATSSLPRELLPSTRQSASRLPWHRRNWRFCPLLAIWKEGGNKKGWVLFIAPRVGLGTGQWNRSNLEKNQRWPSIATDQAYCILLYCPPMFCLICPYFLILPNIIRYACSSS